MSLFLPLRNRLLSPLDRVDNHENDIAYFSNLLFQQIEVAFQTEGASGAIGIYHRRHQMHAPQISSSGHQPRDCSVSRAVLGAEDDDVAKRSVAFATRPFSAL